VSLLEPPQFASWADLEREALACTRCPLAETRTQVVFGVGDPHADLLFVGEGPGEQEDLTGEPFVGRAGRLLTSLIEGIGLTRAQVYIANVVKCRPPGNRDPLPEEIQACESHLFRQLELIRPKMVATLGNFATKLLSGRPDGITRVHGREQTVSVGGQRVTLYPIFHPAAALYTPRMLEVLEQDFARIPALIGREPVPAPVPQLLQPVPAPLAQPEQLGLF
jgi:uracil-DNA glycosylase